MAKVPFVLLVVLLLNFVSAEDLSNNETYLKSESKPFESKIRAPQHPIAIKQSTSTISKSVRKSNHDEDLAQESVEQAQRKGPAQENNYDFGYAVNDAFDGHQFRQEQMTDDGTVHGRFGYRDTKGMFRQVDYMADDYGFRANIRTNEPGTMDLNPANVDIDRMQYVKNDYHPHPKHTQQSLKTSAVKQVNHEYHPDEDEDYQDSYDPKSEDEEETNPQSAYNDSESPHEDQVPKKRGKAIIYQYFHKKHMAPHGEGQHPTTSSDHQNVDKSSHQQPPHYDISVEISDEHDDENMKKIPQRLTIFGSPQAIHHEPQAEHVPSKYEENKKIQLHKAPKYSKLLKERHVHSQLGQPHTFTYDPKPPYSKEDNYPAHIKDNHNPSVIHEHIRHERPYNDAVKVQLYHEKANPNEHDDQQHHTYLHNKHSSESIHAKHPAHYYSPDKYEINSQLENIDSKHREQAYVSPQEEEVYHHGLVRDSTYRRPSKPISQETPIEVSEQPTQRPSYRNRIRSKDQYNEHVSLSKYTTESKYPVKILYTPAQHSETDTASRYQTPIHKKHFREEIVYGFPVDKHIASHDNYEHEVDHPSYDTINETEKMQYLGATGTPYASTYEKQETSQNLGATGTPYASTYEKQETSQNFPQTRKTYLVVHQKHYGPQSNQEHHMNLDRKSVNPKKETLLRQSNVKVGPKFAVLFNPSVFKHFDKFRISGKSNTDESKWIPIIPQIKWLPRSTPPSTDWIPMPSRHIRRYY